MTNSALEQLPANHTKGCEVFVGGLPRSVSEEKIREVFSDCGKIAEIRMIKDQKGNLKGFCFVRFATKESAASAVSEKSGIEIDGKKIGVLPSSQQETLYFGNLNKAWSADEFERLVRQVFPDIESIDLAMLKDVPSNPKQRNRGFAFVKFTSHAAAARAQRVGCQPEFRLGNLHPAVQWSEEERQIDQKELAKVKIAFVRGLPVDAEEDYLKQLFEPFGEVEKVVISKKGGSAFGFVHFTERLGLERAIKELNEKSVKGPKGGELHQLQVEVAKPMERNKKRGRENSESKAPVPGQSKLLKEEKGVVPSNSDNYRIEREIDHADAYEDAVITLPLAVKERLVRILRLGIATRYDIDVKSLRSLKELPEAIAISILDQFMLSATSLQDKGAYLAGLIFKHVEKLGSSRSVVTLPKVVDYRDEAYGHQISPHPMGYTSRTHSSVMRPDAYGLHYSSPPPSYHSSSRTPIGRMDENFLIPNYSHSGQISRRVVDEKDNHSTFEGASGPPLPYGRMGLRSEDHHLSLPVLSAPPSASTSHARLGTGAAGHQSSRPPIRFDPFTGEPYKFDPFTGEPIDPAKSSPPRF